MKELMKVMCLTMPLIIFAFTSSGTVGYLTFGSHVNQDVLLSYRPVTVDVLVATILIAAKMYTDAPILTFVGRYLQIYVDTKSLNYIICTSVMVIIICRLGVSCWLCARVSTA